MSAIWMQFNWHGHDRGSLEFIIMYNPLTGVITYDCKPIGYDRLFTPSVLPERGRVRRTLYETIHDIFEDSDVINNAYDSYRGNDSLQIFAWKEFEEFPHELLNVFGEMTFEEKYAYANGKEIIDYRIEALMSGQCSASAA